METRLIVTGIILVVLLEGFLVHLFLLYRKGKITENPLLLIYKKEMMILFYAFFKWKIPSRNSETFYYHKKSNYFWLYLALVHEQVIEMIVFHIYLKKEAPEIALVMLLLHIYSVFYIMGDYNLLRNTPILLKKNAVHIQIGARRRLSFSLNEIETIQPAKLKYNNSGGIIHERGVFHATAFPRALTRIFGMSDEAKYEIVFKEPLIARGYFGQEKEVQKVLFYIDQPDEFADLIKEKLDHINDDRLVTV
ncbi:hypothetical protein [Mesobacillus jeotgali]|uniref:Uncharacterized protein n=1 Tax=Mesobacillus jeotgali TaxID=129985 RepID=A0ABY9VI25_9BACI|nr:hypothetical protein [Mesobacillus jeotgali]WNF23548.1 hypothetical protein RH061_03280 [Mesobacillus jeotgali]